jgi:hypothetical protein
MNILTIMLNRVHLLLTKVNNQSPFLGAILLVALLINLLFDNLITIIYHINDKPNKINGVLYYLVWGIITLLVYLYARKRKTQIVDIKLSVRYNFVVASIFLFTIIIVIYFGNINREKLSKEKPKIVLKHKKKSLEGRIRKLFE